jgi:hypothetical protein
VNPGLGSWVFSTAQRTIQGYEAMNMFPKGQIEGIAKRAVLAQNQFINRLFGMAASRALTNLSSCSHQFLQYNPVSLVGEKLPCITVLGRTTQRSWIDVFCAVAS